MDEEGFWDKVNKGAKKGAILGAIGGAIGGGSAGGLGGAAFGGYVLGGIEAAGSHWGWW